MKPELALVGFIAVLILVELAIGSCILAFYLGFGSV